MRLQRRTKAQLLAELEALQARVAELEQSSTRAGAPAHLPHDDTAAAGEHAPTLQRAHVIEKQQRLFELLATGAPLEATLAALVRHIEPQLDGGLCSIQVLDKKEGLRLYNAAAPSLPADYTRAINGASIGPQVGSCGTAAFWGKQVIVEDIAHDPLWKDYRDLALAHGLRACWASPFRDSRGEVLGTFAIYYHTPRAPTAAHLAEINYAVHLAAIAVEQKRAEQALRESEQRYRLVARATSDVIWDWDIVAGRLEWNDCAQAMLGYRADEVGTYPLWWDEHLHPDDRARASSGVFDVLTSGGQFWSDEYRFRRADGSYAHILDRGYVIRDVDYAPLRMIGAMQDITERKQAEDALRASEEAAREFQQRLKELHAISIELYSAGSFDELCRMAIELGRSRLGFDRLGLWFRDADARFMHGSFGTDEQGHTRDEHNDRHLIAANAFVQEIFAGKDNVYYKDQQAIYDNQIKVIGEGHSALAALWDGARVIGFLSTDNFLRKEPLTPYHLEILALYSAALGYLCAHKRAEEELERRVAERTAQLEAANKELEAFSYSVSHDLRAPLRHIDGFTRLLAQREGARLDESSARYLRVISEAARKMGQLIDDLLAFSRMSRSELHQLPVPLNQVVADVLHELAPVSEGRSIDWQIAPLPTISGDPAMIKLVFVNLLSNALKYTAPRPTARIGLTASSADNDEIIISVRDNGVGFDMAYAHKLFGVFQRLHRDDEFEGTGIGLATVRRIVSRHGGRIWAEAAVNRGAVFHLTLRRHRSADEKNLAGGR